MSADSWPDAMRLSDLEPVFTCRVCGRKGADVRPDHGWDKGRQLPQIGFR
jgi:hypothetical protein